MFHYSSTNVPSAMRPKQIKLIFITKIHRLSFLIRPCTWWVAKTRRFFFVFETNEWLDCRRSCVWIMFSQSTRYSLPRQILLYYIIEFTGNGSSGLEFVGFYYFCNCTIIFFKRFCRPTGRLSGFTITRIIINFQNSMNNTFWLNNVCNGSNT